MSLNDKTPMNPTVNPAQRPRLVWADVVRLVAMFAVVCCHATDPFNFYPGPEPDNIGQIRFWGAAYGAILRPCVPLFVMLTGALLLPVREETGPFLRRRIGRVLWPFLIWSVIYNLFPWFTGVLGLSPRVILNFFPYSGEAVMQQSIGVSAGYVANIPLNFSPIDVHMWYVYLLIGLYLYLPVFSAWVERASRRAQVGYLALWGLTLLVPLYERYVDPYIWGACSWNSFHMLTYFAGFNGYLLLGHYLCKTEWSLRRTLLVCPPLFAVGAVAAFLGFRHMSAQEGAPYEDLELYFLYCSPQVAMMTIASFMAVRKIRVGSPWVQALLRNLTACGFGIYMIHYFFTGPGVMLMRALHVPVPVQIPLAAVVAMGVSWLIVAGLRRLIGRNARYLLG